MRASATASPGSIGDPAIDPLRPAGNPAGHAAGDSASAALTLDGFFGSPLAALAS